MLPSIRQIIPSDVCLKCDVCCRFPERTTQLVPCFFEDEISGDDSIANVFPRIGEKYDLKMPPVPCGGHARCSFFIPDRNGCSIYDKRPFDCRLYPFMVMYGEDHRSIALAADTKCPYLAAHINEPDIRGYIDYLVSILESDEMAAKISRNKRFVLDFQEDAVVVRRLDKLTARFCLGGYGLTRISLKDKALFDDFFMKTGPLLSSFHFAAVYIWSGALNILWKKIGPALCVFAGNDRDYFLLLPPLGGGLDSEAVKECLNMLVSMNSGSSVELRIENMPEEYIGAAEGLGLKTRPSCEEYVYRRDDLVDLKGEKFRSKRKPLKYFEENYDHDFRRIGISDIFDCLEVYKEWAKGRLCSAGKDEYFRFLIEDSYFAQKLALFNTEQLGLQGGAVEVEGALKGYTLGFPLDGETFVVLFETADLGIKGISQYLFREFANGLAQYRNINALGDSGLDNLRRVKESYRPAVKIPVFTAYSPLGASVEMRL